MLKNLTLCSLCWLYRPEWREMFYLCLHRTSFNNQTLYAFEMGLLPKEVISDTGKNKRKVECGRGFHQNFIHLGSNWMGFLGGSDSKRSACQCRRHKRREFDPSVWKIPWRRKWQSTPLFLLGEFHGQRSLAGYIVHGVANSGTQLSN